MSGDGFRRIVVPTDFSACAEMAWTVALRAARPSSAEVVLVHVLVDTPRFAEGTGGADLRETLDGARQWAERELNQRVAAANASGISARARLGVGVPHEEVLRIATEEAADLIAIGTHGRGGIARALLGSVADRVIRLAPCPVLTVRRPDGADGPE